MTGAQAEVFHQFSHGRLGGSGRELRQRLQDFIRFAGNVRGLRRGQVLADEFFRFRRDGLAEEPGCERDAIVQRDEALADERDDARQHGVVHGKMLSEKVRLETCGQVLGPERADVGRVEVVQFGEVDRGRGGRQIVDVEAFDHLVERHHIVFRNAPAHQHDPVEHPFGDVAEIF